MRPPLSQLGGLGSVAAAAAGHLPASIRYNNPGAQYPAEWARAFGMDGQGVIGGGHLIAHFPDPVSGAAANMALLAKYAQRGWTVGHAGDEWTGRNGHGIPGVPDSMMLSDAIKDKDSMIAIMKSIAHREAGRDSPLTDDQWGKAFDRAISGKQQAGDTHVETHVSMDGKTLARHMSRHMADKLRHSTQAPFADGQRGWAGPDYQILTT
jgi:hypothetical protein